MKMPRVNVETMFGDQRAPNTLWQFDPNHEFDLDSLDAANSLPTKNIFEQWIEADMPDRILVDRQGKVVWCCITHDTAENRDDHGFALSKIRVGGTLSADLLLPILNAGNLAGLGQSRIALIEQKIAYDNIIVRVTPLGHPKTGPLGVTIASRQSFSADARDDLKRIWDLSYGETRVLALTFQGLTAHEVSEATDLSVETIRTHIRRIYTKVGVNSREALFATIGPAIS